MPLKDIANSMASQGRALKSKLKKSGSSDKENVPASKPTLLRRIVPVDNASILTRILLRLEEDKVFSSLTSLTPSPACRAEASLHSRDPPSTPPVAINILPATPIPEYPSLSVGKNDALLSDECPSPFLEVSVPSRDVSQSRCSKSFRRSSLIDCNFIWNETEEEEFSPGFKVMEQLAESNSHATNDPSSLLQVPSSLLPHAHDFIVDDNQTSALSDSIQNGPLSQNVDTNTASITSHSSTEHHLDTVGCGDVYVIAADQPNGTVQESDSSVLDALILEKVPLAATFLHKNLTPLRSSFDPRHLYKCIVSQLCLVNTTCPQAAVDPFTILQDHCEAEDPARPFSGIVFGEPLHNITAYASCRSILGGKIYTLPLIVFKCVEELFRRDIKSPNFLQVHSVSEMQRSVASSFKALFVEFNRGPYYGDNYDLSGCLAEDISSLLTTYLECLPGGVIPRWASQVLDLAVPGTNVYTGISSVNAIVTAQLILRLLSPPQFGLCIYLVAFFTQVAQQKKWNGLGSESLACSFGKPFFGIHKPSGTKDDDNSEIVLKWLIDRWAFVYEGLLKGGIHQYSAEGNDKGADADTLSLHCGTSSSHDYAAPESQLETLESSIRSVLSQFSVIRSSKKLNKSMVQLFDEAQALILELQNALLYERDERYRLAMHCEMNVL